MNIKFFLFICALFLGLYFLWPFLMLIVKGYIYQQIIEYGFYILLLFAGAGFYLWRKLKS